LVYGDEKAFGGDVESVRRASGVHAYVSSATRNQAPKLPGQSVIGEPPGQSMLRRPIVIRESTNRALAPAAPASFRSTRNGSFWPSKSSSGIEIGGFVARRRHPSGIVRLAGGPSSGARYTDTRAPSDVKATQPQATTQSSTVHHRITSRF
jgi:hypothetical protein